MACLKPFKRCKDRINARRGVGRVEPEDGDAEGAEGEDQLLEGKKSLKERLSKVKKVTDINFWKTYTIDPSTNLYYRWLVVVSVAVLYNLVLIIARQVFWLLQQRYAPLWFVLDYTCDIIYMIDIFVQLRTGYWTSVAAFLEDGNLVTDVTRLHAGFVRARPFKLAIFSLLPTDLLYIPFGLDTPVIRINRLARLHRLTECVSRYELVTNYPNVFRVVNLMFYVLLVIHWIACFYYQLSCWAGLGSNIFLYNGTNPENPDLALDYWSCFYWSFMILTTISEMELPTNDLEYVIMTVLYLSGVLIIASILGNVGTAVSKMGETRAHFQQTLDDVKRYMEYRKVGPKLENQVIRWFDYLWSQGSSRVSEDILSELPESFQAEIAMNVHMETLKRVAIFQGCDRGLITQLVLKLKLSVFAPGDYVCRKGDIGKEMYILKRGRLVVVSDDGETVFATLNEGTVFGEISILNIKGNKHGNRRTANIRCAGYCDLFVLSKSDLWEALSEYPDTARHMLEKGQEMLRKDDLIDEAAARSNASSRSEGTVEQRTSRVDSQISEIRTVLARLLADFSSVKRHLTNRLTALEASAAKLSGSTEPPNPPAG